MNCRIPSLNPPFFLPLPASAAFQLCILPATAALCLSLSQAPLTPLGTALATAAARALLPPPLSGHDTAACLPPSWLRSSRIPSQNASGSRRRRCQIPLQLGTQTDAAGTARTSGSALTGVPLRPCTSRLSRPRPPPRRRRVVVVVVVLVCGCARSLSFGKWFKVNEQRVGREQGTPFTLFASHSIPKSQSEK